MEMTRQLNQLPPAKAWLVVHGGHNDGRMYTLKTSRITVGTRKSTNDFFTLSGDLSVSRDHIRLRQDGDHYVLTDLGSRNGTLVNGKQTHECLLRDDDVIRIGATTLIYKYISRNIE